MGVLSAAVKQFDTSKQEMSDIKDTLDLMVELTEAKAREYKEQIETSLNHGRILGKGDSTESLFFPITSVKDARVEYRCITKDTPGDLVDTIKDSICGMIEDHTASGIVEGVAQIINGAMKPLLGLSEGAEQYCASTSTFVEGSGLAMSVVRFDCIIWARAVSAESIKKQIQKTMACVAYKSVVNVKQITFDDFRAVYSPIVELGGGSDILKALQTAREIYDVLGGGTELPKKAPMLRSRKSLTAQDLMLQSKVTLATDGKF